MRSKPILGAVALCVCLSGCQLPANVAYRQDVESWRPRTTAQTGEQARRRGRVPYWPTRWEDGTDPSEQIAALSAPPTRKPHLEPAAPPKTERLAAAPVSATEPIQFQTAPVPPPAIRPISVEKKPIPPAQAAATSRPAPPTPSSKIPHNADMLYQVGIVAMKAGATDEALIWLQSALREDPNHVPSHQALMEHYQKIGDAARAAEHRAKARPPASAPVLAAAAG